jgi:phosphoglycolate phosphatase
LNAKHLVLFDIDGTLLVSNGAGRAATRAAMLEVFGTQGTLDTHHFGGRTDWSSLVEMLGWPPDEIGRRMADYEAAAGYHMQAALADYTLAPCAGAMEAVSALRQRDDTLLGIVTGNVSTIASVKLRAAGFDPAWFVAGAYGSEAYSRNDLPPLALDRVLAATGAVLTPGQVTVVGDTQADVESAQALGARSVAVLTGFSTRAALLAARPDVLLDNLAALPGLLDGEKQV